MIQLETIVVLILSFRVIDLLAIHHEPAVAVGRAQFHDVGRGILERDLILSLGIGVGHQEQTGDGGTLLGRILSRGVSVPSHTYFVRAFPIVLAVGLVLVAWSGTSEVLDGVILLRMVMPPVHIIITSIPCLPKI